MRLPSIVAFPCILVCVFIYVKRKEAEWGGNSVSLRIFAFVNEPVSYVRDRGARLCVDECEYSVCMVCYQKLPSVRWAVPLGMSLFLAESFHYYAVFAMIPFGIAEVALALKERRFRWPVWLALVGGICPLLVFWPLLRNIKAYYGPHVFSRPVFSQLPNYYGAYFLTDGGYGVALALVSVAATAWWSVRAKKTSLQDSGDLAGAVALLSLTILPLVAYFPTRVLHAGLLDRYALAATIGVAVGMAFALSLARPG
jgi:hypothetical protein